MTAAAMANPTPVLPLVGSTIVPPGLSHPLRSASSIMRMPMRSLTEPPGLSISSLAATGVRRPFVTVLSRTRGVFPRASMTLARISVEAESEVVAIVTGLRLGEGFGPAIVYPGRGLMVARVFFRALGHWLSALAAWIAAVSGSDPENQRSSQDGARGGTNAR